MKKWLAAVCAAALVFALAGCAAPTAPGGESETERGSETAGESETAPAGETAGETSGESETETEQGGESGTEIAEFDFRSLDYDAVMLLSRETYTGKTIPVSYFAPVTDEDVDEYVRYLCAQFASYPQAPAFAGTVKEGDGVLLRMRLTVEGEEIADACNYAGDPVATTVGGGELLPGIEQALFGVSVEDHLFSADYGEVEEGGTVYVSFTPDGGTLPELVRVAPAEAALVGLSSGESAPMTAGGVSGTATVLFTVEEHPLCVPVTFDKNMPEFEGKTGEFLLSFAGYYPVTVPEFDEAFIREHLGSESEQHGDALVAEARERLRAELEASWQEAYASFCETAIMDYFRENLTFYELPAGLLEICRSELLADLYDAFAYYSTYYASSFPYETPEAFAGEYFGTELPLDEYLDGQTAYVSKGLLVMYGVAIREGLMPDEEAILAAYEKMMEEELSAYLAEGYEVTREELEAYYGRESIMKAAEDELIYTRVIAFLREHNTLAPEEAPEPEA